MTNAILMASGLGTRMRPLTDATPKPLIKVNDKPMIETIIEALQLININKIYIVVGYLAEQFNYLKEKYSNIYIINNPDYKTINNISSIYYAKDKLLDDDCFICEADLYVSDKNIFNKTPDYSCYFGKMVEGYSADWVFDLDGKGYITRVGKIGNNQYNMVGISYFTRNDAKIIAEAINEKYHTFGYESLFWDDIVNQNLDKLKLKIHSVNETQLVEIDTVDELKQVIEKINKGKYCD